MGLVVKSWAVDNKPVDDAGNYAVIKCRQEGVLAFLLSMVGIDPVTTLLVHPDRIEFIQASLNGTNRRIIPLTSVSSTFYGFHKPLKEVLAFIVVALFLSLVVAGFAGGMLCAIVLIPLVIAGGGIYYYLNKKVSLGIVEVSGLGFGARIEFKRSLIEGKNVDEPEARLVCTIVQTLVEARLPKP